MTSATQTSPKVLIVKLSSLGDLFHALPTVHRIKAGLGATIDWVVQAEYVDLVNCFDDVDRVIPFHRRDVLSHATHLWRDLHESAYDYAIDLQGLMKSAVIARLAGARRCLGPSYHREGSRLFYHRVAGKVDRSRHAVEQALDVVPLLGVSSNELRFPVSFPEARLTEAGPRIAIAPQSRWATKNWSVDRFVEVANSLLAARGGTVYVLGGPEDRAVADSMEAGIKGPVRNMVGRVSLVETGGILNEMDVLVANDTGPVHMAAALGIPTVVIFGATNPRRTGPYGDGHLIAESDLYCRPCLSRVCKRGDKKCLADVTVADVVEKVNRVLDARAVA